MSSFILKVLNLPNEIANSINKFEVNIDSKLTVQQPENCLVVRALFMQWQANYTEQQLSDPSIEIEMTDITRRFQTYWTLFSDGDRIECEKEELLGRLNLSSKITNMSWAILVTYNLTKQKRLYSVLLGYDRRVKFPPYCLRTRSFSAPNKRIDGISVLLDNDREQHCILEGSRILEYLGPNADFMSSSDNPTPEWLIVRFFRQQYPTLTEITCYTKQTPVRSIVIKK